ncbi:MAG: deoxyribodipyrimidine photo-lyase [Bacteroidota bacterium]|jgi:deoxyribodipyrimidine photo-lyase
MASSIHPGRIRTLQENPDSSGPIVYWMSRDQRVDDNWALLFAQSLAMKYKAPLAVLFCLAPEFLDATIRQYGFMLEGLRGVEKKLKEKNIPFSILSGDPKKEVPAFARKENIAGLVTDFNPLNINREWKTSVQNALRCSMYEVDAHNIVPCWSASPKQEYGAYTFRPKIHRLLPAFLEEFPPVRKHPYNRPEDHSPVDWIKIKNSLRVNSTVGEVSWISPGEKSAKEQLSGFIKKRLRNYNEERNDPTQNAQSHLSPYLHFGQISAERIALDLLASCRQDIQEILFKMKNGASEQHGNVSAFLEELIVRRELSDNFTHYNHRYTSFDCFPAWAQQSLNEHRHDAREFIYTKDQFERAETHDPLWNAAQREMVMTGKMHGYMRMYWGKKILEWSPSPEEALSTAIQLNDRYQLDGRDPNGYAGIAWSIGGLHDRAWFERPVFGKIRYMNYNGCKSKFDVEKYIAEMEQLV